MKTSELCAVIDREVKLLADDNWHAAAAVMAEAAERLRVLADRLRAAGLGVDVVGDAK